mgnify:CR=1 FL=1
MPVPSIEPSHMTKAMRSLLDLVRLPLVHATAFDTLKLECPRGILLRGPPGVGKTWTVRTVARAVPARLFVVECANLFTALAGEAEERLRALFAEATAAAEAGPAILFMDEIVRRIIFVLPPCAVLPYFGCAFRARLTCVLAIPNQDVICPKRDEEDANTARMVAQVLTLMDGLKARGKVYNEEPCCHVIVY